MPAVAYRVSLSVVLDNAAPNIVHAVNPFRWFTAKNIHLCNTAAIAVTASIFLVPFGSTPLTGNAALYTFSLQPKDFIEFGEGLMLAPGGTVYGQASSATSITVTLSGIEEQASFV